MPRFTFNAAMRGDTDANYRLVVQGVEDAMAASGLVRTDDTGQINPAGIVRVASTDMGYSVWRFNDALQSAAPVFIKLTHRIGNTINTMQAKWQIGDGTDGAGNLTGLVVDSGYRSPTFSNATAVTYDSYFTHSNGFFGSGHMVGLGGTYNSPYSAVIQRSVDNTGAPTAEAVIGVFAGQPGSFADIYRKNLTIPTSVITYRADYQSVIVGNISDSRVGIDPQIYMHWTTLPKVRPLVGTASCIATDVPDKTILSTTLVGTTPRTYLNVGNALARSAYGPSGVNTLILWED